MPQLGGAFPLLGLLLTVAAQRGDGVRVERDPPATDTEMAALECSTLVCCDAGGKLPLHLPSCVAV